MTSNLFSLKKVVPVFFYKKNVSNDGKSYVAHYVNFNSPLYPPLKTRWQRINDGDKPASSLHYLRPTHLGALFALPAVVQVVSEVHRVMKPGGVAIFSFSNRCPGYPPQLQIVILSSLADIFLGGISF